MPNSTSAAVLETQGSIAKGNAVKRGEVRRYADAPSLGNRGLGVSLPLQLR